MFELTQKKWLRIVLLIVGLTGGWLFLWAGKFDQVTKPEVYWNAVLYTLCCIPTVFFIRRYGLYSPLMPLWGAGYFLLFGMPMLAAEELLWLGHKTPEEVVVALQVVSAGALICILAFYSPLGAWVEPLVPALKTPWNERRAPAAGLLLCLVGIFLQYRIQAAPPTMALSQPLLILARSCATLGTVTLFLLQLRGLLRLKLKVLLWGVSFPIILILGIGTGSIFNALRMISPLLICYTVERGRVPIFTGFLVMLVCFAPFSGFKSEFRAAAWYGEEGIVDPNAGPLEKGLAFIELVSLRVTEGGVDAYMGAVESASARVSHLDVLISVIDLTPDFIPYWNGQTYTTLLWTFAPRFFFPNKPEKTVGIQFGHKYGYLHPDDTDTSFNLPHQVIEMYVNFGIAGALVGMALLGLVYRMVAQVLSQRDTKEVGLIIGSGVTSILLSMDGDLSLIIGGLIYNYASFLILSKLFLAGGRTPAAAGGT